MTRLITEGREGRHVRNRIYVSFQEDMKARCRLFMVISLSSRLKGGVDDNLEIIFHVFWGALVAQWFKGWPTDLAD